MGLLWSLFELTIYLCEHNIGLNAGLALRICSYAELGLHPLGEERYVAYSKQYLVMICNRW